MVPGHLALFVLGVVVLTRAWGPTTALSTRSRGWALVVPLAVATAAVLARRTPWAGAALCGVVGRFALVPPSVAAMSVVTFVRDDPAVTVGDTALANRSTGARAGAGGPR